MSQDVFYVVPENPQEPHVANDVQPPAVQEHRGDDRRRVETGGNQSIIRDEVIPRVVVEREFMQKHYDIQNNDQDGDDWTRVAGLRVPNWKHLDGSMRAGAADFEFRMRAALGPRH